MSTTATTKVFENAEMAEKFRRLQQKVQQHELMRTPRADMEHAKIIAMQHKGLGAIRITLNDIEEGINMYPYGLETRQSIGSSTDSESIGWTAKKSATRRVMPYIKITLRKTECILLYEQRSCTVLRDTDEGREVEEDNKLYDRLTAGKGSMRRRADAEAQTTEVLYKTREANTETIRTGQVGSYVSNYEMFDTYKDLEATTKSIEVEGQQKLEVTTYKVRGVDRFIEISRHPSFQLAVMLTNRILAGNVFEESQRRFRNMNMPDPLATDVRYLYRLQVLWRYMPQFIDDGATRRAVADISWCRPNGDILAVAYGIYSYSAKQLPRDGCVCVWNIKNPVNPERYFHFPVPVVAVEFSTLVPQLLAVGFYDGSVQVRDITNANHPPVAVSHRSTSPSYEAILAFRWTKDSVKDDDDDDDSVLQPFLALSQDGSVTKFRIVNSPELLGFHQMVLDRVEGVVEGLEVQRPWDRVEANRRPQGLNLCLHPLQPDIYYILTDEGCLHKCSTINPHQYIEVSQVHEAGVNCMDFSPWSPKLFLTCGNDWCIRIWMDGIFKPIITLQNAVGPVHCAYWSKTHSTIIVSANRNTIDIWDIRRSTLRPISSTNLENCSYNTTFKLSNCGRSLAIGNERGEVTMLAFEDMPFPLHFQYGELENAIFREISNDAQLTRQVRSLGYFGYPKK